MSAGFKEWGGKIQSDINDGVAWLIRKKIADPKRIGIYGTGFGGNIALNSSFISDYSIYHVAIKVKGF
ncbi:hypothetical protein D3C72_2389730 [compost metagenome]